MASTLEGLSEAEVADRVRRGQTNDVAEAPSRTVWGIVRANVFTPFNALLGGLLVVILAVGPLQDALFGGVLVANTAVGIYQELRAKRALDRLAVLTAPRARVVREGTAREVEVGAVVLGDLLELQPGDQVIADGEVVESQGLEVDESLLSGEADPVSKGPGDELLSGSFVAAGSGRYRATRVAADAYARSLAREARRFSLVSSELRDGVNRIVALVSWALVPTAALLFFSQIGKLGLRDALRGSVAGTVAMVPEGLVLLTSVAFAAGIVRLGRRNVLVQELPAVEVLARVDVLCIDKTGTLTEGRMRVVGVEPLTPDAPVAEALASLVASDPTPNVTMHAVAAAFPREPSPSGEAWRLENSVPFSSARKWSGAAFEDRGTWLLGAPEVVYAAMPSSAPGRARAEELAQAGNRVLLLATTQHPLLGSELPPRLAPIALIALRDRIRPDAAATLRYFAEQQVTMKVLSGDDPQTVAAIAGGVGLAGSDRAVDARGLPEDPAGLADVLEESEVFGRVTPRQKRAMVAALQSRRHVVAMTGDGVNDVLALRDADLGIAMGSGSAATRAVAQIVLLDSAFSSLPPVVAEGRRVLANIERTANLFLTKTVYALLLALAVGVLRLPFPFLPRHLTLVGNLTIGVPAFFLALAPNARRARPGFVRRVLRFAVPAGIVAAGATFAAYVTVHTELAIGLAESRTAATVVLLGVGFVVLAIVASPLNRARSLLIAWMVATAILVLLVPGLRDFFALPLPPAAAWVACAGIVAAAAVILRIAHRWLLPRADEEVQGPAS